MMNGVSKSICNDISFWRQSRVDLIFEISWTTNTYHISLAYMIPSD